MQPERNGDNLSTATGRPPDKERTPAGEAGARSAAWGYRQSQHTENDSQSVDVERYRLGVAQADSVGAVLAASILDDPVWDFADVELKLSAARLLERSLWNLDAAVAQ